MACSFLLCADSGMVKVNAWLRACSSYYKDEVRVKESAQTLSSPEEQLGVKMHH